MKIFHSSQATLKFVMSSVQIIFSLYLLQAIPSSFGTWHFYCLKTANRKWLQTAITDDMADNCLYSNGGSPTLLNDLKYCAIASSIPAMHVSLTNELFSSALRCFVDITHLGNTFRVQSLFDTKWNENCSIYMSS